MNTIDTNQRSRGSARLSWAALLSAALLTLAACGQTPVDNSVICCELPDGTVSSETTTDCKELTGTVVDDDLCECDDEVCCELDDGTFQTLPESECANIASPDRCEDVSPAEDICCKTENGYETIPATDCPDGQQAASEDLCTSDEEACCKMDDGTFQTLPATDCPDAQTVSPDFCSTEELCCRIDGQFVTVPANQCPTGSEAPADMCTDEGSEVCCETAAGYMTVADADCPDAQEVSPDLCVQDIDVCCETATGYMTLPSSQCPQAQQASAELCAEVCCKTDQGTQYVPAAECDPTQTVSADVCEREVCCETIDGFETLTQAECPQSQVTDPLWCEERICCETPDGATYVPASQCDPATVLDDEMCITPQTECLKFRAVDMSTLPYTTTAGDTLQSFTSNWGTFSVQTGWSSSCLDQPPGAQRAFVGVGNDLTLNYAAPVSSLFLLRYHAQPGDELIVPGASTTATSCGASSYHNITRVDLTSSSTSVTIQDLSPSGGTGYSVLLAECIEWSQD